jgi:inosine-uridine nucleoside N-ribohydrolase
VTNQVPLVLDCDPGHDDAIAIVVAARHAELLGITTVAGNAPLEQTTRNALILRDLLGIDVPVHSGADRPLLEVPRHGTHIHGTTGLDGAELPEPSRPVDGTDAVSFIIETCRRRPGTWLVGVGPLTNLALALRSASDLAGLVGGISVMGGGTFGNRSAVAEYNIWADPEAAALIFGYGGPLVMAGLDVTYQLQATPERLDRLAAVPGRLAETLTGLLRFYSTGYITSHENVKGAAIHDPCAVLALTHRQLFRWQARHVAVETSGQLTRGMTVIDRRNLIDRPSPTCEVLEAVADDDAFGVIVEAIASFSR